MRRRSHQSLRARRLRMIEGAAKAFARADAKGRSGDKDIAAVIG